MTLDDPAVVRAEYEDETRLASRKAAYTGAEGPDAREVLFGAIAETRPRRILDVGCGEGELAECVVAAWMLYHVRDLDRALAEMARVLTPGGRLVAVTNGRDHCRELYELIERGRMPSSFLAEDAESLLRRHFPKIEGRDAHGWLVFPDAEAAQAYVDSLVLLEGARVPPVEGEIRVRRSATIFIAEK